MDCRTSPLNIALHVIRPELVSGSVLLKLSNPINTDVLLRLTAAEIEDVKGRVPEHHLKKPMKLRHVDKHTNIEAKLASDPQSQCATWIVVTAALKLIGGEDVEVVRAWIRDKVAGKR